MWKRSNGSFLSEILLVIANFMMNDISHDNMGLPRSKYCYVPAMRSCDVIKGHQNVFFLPLASHRKEWQYRAWSQCVQLIKPHRMVYILTLIVKMYTIELKSPFDLDLMRSSYSYFDTYQREDLDGAIIFALARLVQKLLGKKPLSSSAAIWLFYPCDVVFDLT